MMRTNHLLFFLFLVLLAISCIGCQSHFSLQFPTAPPVGKKQLLITFENRGDQLLPGGSKRSYLQSSSWGVPLYLADTIQQLEKQFQMQHQAGWLMDSIDMHCVVFLVDAHRDLNTLIQSLQLQPGIDHVQPMQQFEVMSTATSNTGKPVYNDSHLQLQYGQFVNQLTELHAFSRGAAVKVGVVDTYSDQEHPDLNGQIRSQTVYVDNVSYKKSAQHGTAVAGIISARANNGLGLVGLAPEAELYVYAACNSDNGEAARCNSFNVLQALEQAIRDEVHVLNLSIAGPYDFLVEKVLKVALEKNIVVVAALNSESREQSFPAVMQDVVAVKEIAANPNSDNDSFGDWIVQSEKLSTLSGGGYRFFYGSSISTASISAIAALYRAKASTTETRYLAEALADGRCNIFTDQSFKTLSMILQQPKNCRR